MNIIIKNKFSENVIILFFIALLFVYGRGPSFDVKADEQTHNVVASSKAPFLIISTLSLLLLSDKKKILDFSYLSNYRYWFTFFGVLFILIFFRNNYEDDLVNFISILLSYLWVILLIKFAFSIPFNRLEDLFICITFLISICCVIIHILQGHKVVFFPDRSEENFDRLGGIFYYAHTAAVVGITTLFSAKKLLETKKLIYFVILTLSAIMLVATDTRSSWFAVFFSFIFIFFRKINFYLILLLALIFYLNVDFFTGLFTQHKLSIANTGEDAEFRTKIWDFTLEIAEKSIVTGYGAIKPLETEHFSLNNNLHDPHNSIISLLLQSGIIAVIVYFFIYFSNIQKCIKYFHSEYRFLFFYWLFFPFFWGSLYDSLSGVVQVLMFFSIYAFALNPNGTRKVIIQMPLKIIPT